MSVSSDIELAAIAIDLSSFEQLSALLPNGYSVENRVDTGYGLVVRSPLSDAEMDLEEKFNQFLSPLLPVASALKEHGCILRVAIFCTSASSTTTCTTSMLELLNGFSAALETSTYPTEQVPD